MLNFKEIVYGTQDEMQDVMQLFADWDGKHIQNVDEMIRLLKPYSRRWAGHDSIQSETLCLATKKALLANDAVKARKLWALAVGPKSMRHWGGMWLVLKEQWFGKERPDGHH